MKELGVDAVIRGSHLVARGASAERLIAAVHAPRVTGTKTDGTFDVTIDSLQATGRAFEKVRARGSLKDKLITADVQVAQDSLVSYALLGRYSQSAAGEHDIMLDSLRARFDTITWRLAHPSAVRLGTARIAIDSVDLRSSAGGRLFANGLVPKDGAIQLDVAADNVQVATILAALQEDRVATGVVEASARIEGTRAAPLIAARASLRGATYRNYRAPDVNLTARYANMRLAVDATGRDTTQRRVFVSTALIPLNLALASVDGSRKVPGPISADITMDTLSLASLPIPATVMEDVRGTLSGEAHARGTWERVEGGGHAALRGGAFRMPLATTGMRTDNIAADVRFVHDTLFLDSLVATARGSLRAQGSVDFTDRKRPFVNLSAAGEDLRVFDSPRGLVDANARVMAKGPSDSIRVTGRGEMLGGYLALKQFRKDLLRVKPPGDLSFFTVFDTSTTPEEKLRVAEAKRQKHSFAVVADLELAVDRGNYYRNRPDANTEFYTGDETVVAHLDTRTSEQWAVGFVRIGHGVAYFRTRAFIPQRGTLTVTPVTGGAALVQQVGERIVWDAGRGLFPLQMLTGGTGTGPSVGLESGTLFPMRGRELNGYLTMGRLNLSLLQQSGSSLSGSEGVERPAQWRNRRPGASPARSRTALGVVLHDIGTGATKEWKLDAFSVSPSDVPTELVYGKTGGVRGALIEGGKYITTDLYLAGQLHFTSGIPGVRVSRQFGTEYRLDAGVEPRFLFRDLTELGITHPTVRSGAVGAYFTRLWGY